MWQNHHTHQCCSMTMVIGLFVVFYYPSPLQYWISKGSYEFVSLLVLSNCLSFWLCLSPFRSKSEITTCFSGVINDKLATVMSLVGLHVYLSYFSWIITVIAFRYKQVRDSRNHTRPWVFLSVFVCWSF